MKHLSVFVAITLAGALRVAGQSAPVAVDLERIPEAPSCISCRIAARLDVTIGSERDSVTIGLGARFAIDARENTYVAPLSAAQIFEYDWHGTLLRVVGRRGQGPGEFQTILLLAIGPGDSLFVVDNARRLTVFAPLGAVARTGRVPFQLIAMFPLSDGKIVSTAFIESGAQVGMPIHLLGPTGQYIRSFGVDRALLDPVSPLRLGRNIALASGGKVWSSYESLLERWDTVGTRDVSLRRETKLFPNEPVVTGRGPAPAPPSPNVATPLVKAAKPNPVVIGMGVDDQGRLWIATTIGAADWAWRSRACAYCGRHRCTRSLTIDSRGWIDIPIREPRLRGYRWVSSLKLELSGGQASIPARESTIGITRMQTVRLFSIALGGLALGWLEPRPLSGQRIRVMTPQQRIAGEVECRASAAQVANDVPAEKRHALGAMLSCPDTGAAILASQWRHPPADSATLRELITYSQAMIDSRLADAELATLQNRSHGTVVRAGALQALAAQLDTTRVIASFTRIAAETITTRQGHVVHSDEFVSANTATPYVMQLYGKSPVTEGVRERIRLALRELERNTDDRFLFLAIVAVRSIVDSPKP